MSQLTQCKYFGGSARIFKKIYKALEKQKLNLFSLLLIKYNEKHTTLQPLDDISKISQLTQCRKFGGGATIFQQKIKH